MEVIDYLRSAALVVSFLATAFVGRKTWLLAQAIAMSAFGAGFLLFPKVVYGYQVIGTLDVLQLVVLRWIGIGLVAFAVALFLSRESRDACVQTALLLCSTLTSFLLLQAMVIDHYYGKAKGRFNEKHQYFGMLGTLLLLVGNVVNLGKGGLVQSRHTSSAGRIGRQLIVLLVIHAMMHFYRFGFPEHSMTFMTQKDFKVDPLHLHLVRILGACGLGWTLYLYTALAFQDVKDKRNVFLHDILVLVVMFPLQLYYSPLITVAPAVRVIVTTFGLLMFGNAVIGYAGHRISFINKYDFGHHRKDSY